ncbi:MULTISPECIES: MFS transporter [unclassified Bradyrhizobium]|uniref:MFS transporter n=1 Tax=unclassified Bradyrhizobium TaxID=2631580 RepID=UPI0028E25FD7|nr:MULTISPECIES: MFS transporter [unclassified Bradyrhizobium]
MILFWLALSAFAIGTETFLLSGLLNLLSTDLGISAAVAGQLATVFALTYAIGSPVLAVLFSNFDRKTVLLLALVSFALANILAGFSLDFGHLTAARVLMALAAGLFMPTANAVAVAVSAPKHGGRAIATVSSGLTIATALGVPFGTFIGYQLGWRSIFLLIAGLSALAVVGLAYGLPRGLPRTTASLGQRLAVAGRGKVLRALLVTVLWATGGYIVFPYLSTAFASAGIEARGISLALFLFGSAAAAGNILGGILVDRIGSTRTTAYAFTLSILVLGAISLTLKTGPAPHSSFILLTLMVPWGIAAWAFPPAQNAHLVRTSPDAPVIALSLNASALYFGMALGSLLGGLTLSWGTASDLGWVGALSAVITLAVLLIFSRIGDTNKPGSATTVVDPQHAMASPAFNVPKVDDELARPR